MFKIGDFSKICRVPVSTLRFYADRGLLPPAHVDPATGFRYYTLDQLPRLNRLLALKDLGLSLDQIELVLAERLTAEQLQGMLRLREAEVRQQVGEAQALLRRVSARLRQIELEDAMSVSEVVLKAIEPLRVVSRREIAPTPEQVGALLGETCMAAMQGGVAFGGAPFVIFHDAAFSAENLDVEVVIPVAAEPAGAPEAGGRALVAHTLPGVAQAACLLHAGDFDGLPQSYTALGQWIEGNGYQIAGPAREVYLRAPDEAGGALTEIQWPVTARG